MKTHTTLKVYVESFTPEPGGILQCTSTNNDGSELRRHTFPAGVVKDFDTLVQHEARTCKVDVLADYVTRHDLFNDFRA